MHNKDENAIRKHINIHNIQRIHERRTIAQRINEKVYGMEQNDVKKE